MHIFFFFLFTISLSHSVFEIPSSRAQDWTGGFYGRALGGKVTDGLKPFKSVGAAESWPILNCAQPCSGMYKKQYTFLYRSRAGYTDDVEVNTSSQCCLSSPKAVLRQFIGISHDQRMAENLCSLQLYVLLILKPLVHVYIINYKLSLSCLWMKKKVSH